MNRVFSILDHNFPEHFSCEPLLSMFGLFCLPFIFEIRFQLMYRGSHLWGSRNAQLRVNFSLSAADSFQKHCSNNNGIQRSQGTADYIQIISGKVIVQIVDKAELCRGNVCFHQGNVNEYFH